MLHRAVRRPQSLSEVGEGRAAAREWSSRLYFAAENLTLVRLLWPDAQINPTIDPPESALFRVEDRHVRSVHTRFGEPVYEDSCVEIFLAPKPGRGYLNFEMNAGGALLASHVTDHRRTPDGFAAFKRLTAEDGGRVAVRSSLPPVVEPEVEGPVGWTLAFFIPKELLEKYVGPIGPLPGQAWRANLYKCGDRTSHPHWASWSPVDALNFHLPHCFGTLRFEP